MVQRAGSEALSADGQDKTTDCKRHNVLAGRWFSVLEFSRRAFGVNKLREITDDEKCPFVMYVGSKRLVKRKLFENYIDNTYSI